MQTYIVTHRPLRPILDVHKTLLFLCFNQASIYICFVKSVLGEYAQQNFFFKKLCIRKKDSIVIKMHFWSTITVALNYIKIWYFIVQINNRFLKRLFN